MRAWARSSPASIGQGAREGAHSTARRARRAGWRRRKMACRRRCRRRCGQLSAPGWAFHWALEFPEVFHGKRPDPLDAEQANKAAWMDGFVGNPPFAGKNGIIEAGGENYLPWLQVVARGRARERRPGGAFLPARVSPARRARHHRLHRHQHHCAGRHAGDRAQVHGGARRRSSTTPFAR